MELLTDDEILEIVSFIPTNHKNFVYERWCSQLRDRFIDELSQIRRDSVKFGISKYKELLRNALVNASSLVGESMIRSSQNFVKALIQETISSKKGTIGKSVVVQTSKIVKNITSYSKQRNIKKVWLHAAQPAGSMGIYSHTMKEVETLARDIFDVEFSTLVDDVDVNENEKCVEMQLYSTRLYEYSITMHDIRVILSSNIKEKIKTVLSAEDVGLIKIYPVKGKESLTYFLGTVRLAIKNLKVKGIPGVEDSFVEKFEGGEALTGPFRVVGVSNGNTSTNEWKYRIRVNLAHIISSHMLEEDVVHAFSLVYSDFEYDSVNHYFYINDKNNIDSVKQLLVKYVINVTLKSTSDILFTILKDKRFDNARTLTNDLAYNYKYRGCEHALQWCNMELKTISKIFEYHTLHPIIERMFALGFPTPVSERGNKDRNIGVLASITFSKGEDTLRSVAVEQVVNKNDNVYSAHKIGTPSPTGSNMRLGIDHPYVGIYHDIAIKYGINSYHGSIPERFTPPIYSPEVVDYTKNYEEVPVKELDLNPIATKLNVQIPIIKISI